MIRSWADRRSQRFYEQRRRTGFRGMDVAMAEDHLAALDAATSLRDLSPLRCVGLHKLTTRPQGPVGYDRGPWRICFRFKDGDACDVEIVDYHRG